MKTAKWTKALFFTHCKEKLLQIKLFNLKTASFHDIKMYMREQVTRMDPATIKKNPKSHEDYCTLTTRCIITGYIRMWDNASGVIRMKQIYLKYDKSSQSAIWSHFTSQKSIRSVHIGSVSNIFIWYCKTNKKLTRGNSSPGNTCRSELHNYCACMLQFSQYHIISCLYQVYAGKGNSASFLLERNASANEILTRSLLQNYVFMQQLRW